MARRHYEELELELSMEVHREVIRVKACMVGVVRGVAIGNEVDAAITLL